MRSIVTAPARNLIHIALIVGGLLLVPLALTLLNPQASVYNGGGGGWDWMPGDFVVMGALLFAAGYGIDLALRNLSNPAQRVGAVLAIVAALVLIWVELAVDAVSQLVHFLLTS